MLILLFRFRYVKYVLFVWCVGEGVFGIVCLGIVLVLLGFIHWVWLGLFIMGCQILGIVRVEGLDVKGIEGIDSGHLSREKD